jgi:putative colanic acid biosynthesis UDP-glucose lipid carrier transferase
MLSTRRLLRDNGSVISLATRFLDAIAIGVSALLAYAIRFGFGGFPIPNSYLAVISIVMLLSLVLFPSFGLYQSWRGRSMLKLLSQLFAAWGTVILVFVSILFLLKASAGYSRAWFGYWSVITLCWLFAVRIIVFQFLRALRRRGRNHKRVVLIGAGDFARSVVRRLASAPAIGFDVVALLDDDPRFHGKSFAGAQVVGGLRMVCDVVDGYRADEVWIALPLEAAARVHAILHDLRHSTVNIRFLPDIFGFRLLNHSVSEIAGMPVLDLNVSPMSGHNRIIKAIEDRVLALLILFLISPLLIFIAAGVKLSSPGPVLFKQMRNGWDGKPIRIYKFRTMKLHKEEEGVLTQARKGDKRVTRFGAFLRRTSLDELPQFFNVLQGRMSIVGPRPHALIHNEFYKDQVEAYMLRHKVKPGITGWAQVNGWRGETDILEKMQKRLEYDLYYIDNWSLLFDLKIIGLTITAGFFNKNAY